MQVYLDEIKQRKYALEPTCGQFSAALPGVMSLSPPPNWVSFQYPIIPWCFLRRQQRLNRSYRDRD